MKQTAERYHDISCGHRVAGHESKCAMLHGHNYRVHFTCEVDQLDALGRVVDFSVIKSTLCEWLEVNWDHKFLAWKEDPVINAIVDLLEDHGQMDETSAIFGASIVWVPFNPTAENIAGHLLEEIGPRLLPKEVRLISVKVEETRKCSAGASL